MDNVRSTPLTLTWWRPVAAFVLLFLIWQVVDVLLLVFGGILLALIFGSLASAVQRRTHWSRGVAVSLVLTVLTLLVGLGLYLLGDSVAGQVRTLSQELPRVARDLQERLAQTSWGGWIQMPSREQLMSGQSGLLSRASGYLYSSFGVLGSLLALVVIGAWIASEPQTYKEGTVQLFSPSHRSRIRNVLCETARRLRSWLKAKFINMTIAAVMTTLGLWALGIPMALALGVIAGLMEFVPNFGPLVAALPALLIALPMGMPKVAAVAGLYVAIQLVQSNLITPWVERQVAALPPALVLIAQVVLGTLLGVGGVILAAPLTAAALVIVRRLYVEDAVEGGAA